MGQENKEQLGFLSNGRKADKIARQMLVALS